MRSNGTMPAAGRAHASSSKLLGGKPADDRGGGPNAELRFAVGECALGAVLVAGSDRGVCAILLGDDADALRRELRHRFPRARLTGGDAAFERRVVEVVRFVETPGRGLD